MYNVQIIWLLKMAHPREVRDTHVYDVFSDKCLKCKKLQIEALEETTSLMLYPMVTPNVTKIQDEYLSDVTLSWKGAKM